MKLGKARPGKDDHHRKQGIWLSHSIFLSASELLGNLCNAQPAFAELQNSDIAKGHASFQAPKWMGTVFLDYCLHKENKAIVHLYLSVNFTFLDLVYNIC